MRREIWQHVEIQHIEDLSDFVLGAGLDAIDMGRKPVSGSLVFTRHDGITISSGLIQGWVATRGPLSEHEVSIVLGLRFNPGSRQWLEEVGTGNVGIYLPGDVYDSLYAPDSLYATVTLTVERLELEAARQDLVLHRDMLGGSGIHTRKLDEVQVAELRSAMLRVHGGDDLALGHDPSEPLVATIVEHFSRAPRPVLGRPKPRVISVIVARARDYIEASLEQPISVDAIAGAAFTSRRTLHRAFAQILGETPHAYVRRLRLHRIRRALVDPSEAACTVALAANRWGISELGRLSRSYRQLFGEYPSETLARRCAAFSRQRIPTRAEGLAGSA